MIKYDLTCTCGCAFESWFSSSVEFEKLIRKKLITCVACNSTSVKKSIMAPNLSSKIKKNYSTNKNAKDVRKKLIEFRNFVEKNFKYVGDRFTEEARKIYYDKKSSKNIYGKASPEETAELADEGIEVSTIPWIDKSEN